MTNLIIRLFIKDYKDINNPVVRQNYGKLSGVVGIVSNIFLTIIKIVTGVIIGSIAIIADGINNLSDASTSIVTLFGFRFSSMPPDKEHPYGHQRIEYIAGLIVSIFVLIVGLGLMQTSVKKVITPEELAYSPIIVIVLVISILLKIWQMSFYRYVGKLINSTTLIATAFDSLSDVFATTVVLIGMIVLKYTTFNIDGYLGLVISIFIIFSGIKLIKDTISPLLGEAPTSEFIDIVANHIKSYDGILGYHDIVVHSYGPYRTFVTVDVEVDCRIDIMVTHELIDRIEYDFRKKGLGNLVIHIDPVDTVCEKISRYKQMVTYILQDIDSSLRFHDLRTGTGTRSQNLMFDVVVPFESSLDLDSLKIEIKERIKEVEPNINPLITIEKSNIV